MKNWFNLILISLFFHTTTAFAQVGLKFEYPAEVSTLSLDFNATLFNYNLSDLKINTGTQLQNSSLLNQNFKSFPKIYSYHNLAFFCKVEVKLEKAAKFPVKFRLGDVNYVDQLEGK